MPTPSRKAKPSSGARHAKKSRPASPRAPSKAKPTKATSSRPKSSKRPAPRPAPARPAAGKTLPAKPFKPVPLRPAAKAAPPKPTAPPVPAVLDPRRTDGRRHVLSLSFLRDGDEFMARLETDAGQITELKNRSLDQLLSLVANELEDLIG
jgi:hypothetical protein